MKEHLETLLNEIDTATTYPQRPLHVLILGSGSVASIKISHMVHLLNTYKDVKVQVCATESCLHFCQQELLHQGVQVWKDNDEWNIWKSREDPILHIELRRWADIVLVAPCSANTLAKMSTGICDNLVTSVLRAVDLERTKVYVFPSMNTAMYKHPLTAKQLNGIKELGYKVYGPISKNLPCGDEGTGAMYEWSNIVQLVVDQYNLEQKSVD